MALPPRIAAPMTLQASTTESADGLSAALDIGERATVRLTLTATAASGTLDVSLETSDDDDAATWRTAGAFAQLAAVGAKDLEVVGVERFVRARWAIAGDAPSFTFAIAGRAVTAYTNRALIEALGIDAEAIREVQDDDVARAASAASREYDRHIWLRDTPLREREVTADVVQDASIIAAYHLMSVRGFDAQREGTDIVSRYRDTIDRLTALDGGKKLPPFDTGPATTDSIQIATSARRGWGCR